LVVLLVSFAEYFGANNAILWRMVQNLPIAKLCAIFFWTTLYMQHNIFIGSSVGNWGILNKWQISIIV